jgi:hypothetical protein
MLLAIGWRHHRGVRAHEPGAPLMEPGICMGDGLSTEAAKSAGMSPLRLRVGVFLILLWIVPFWAVLLIPAPESRQGSSQHGSVHMICAVEMGVTFTAARRRQTRSV